jgi:hypothetical protein
VRFCSRARHDSNGAGRLHSSSLSDWFRERSAPETESIQRQRIGLAASGRTVTPRTIVIFRKPVSTSVLISSHPIPPAPTIRTFAAPTCRPVRVRPSSARSSTHCTGLRCGRSHLGLRLGAEAFARPAGGSHIARFTQTLLEHARLSSNALVASRVQPTVITENMRHLSEG